MAGSIEEKEEKGSAKQETVSASKDGAKEVERAMGGTRAVEKETGFTT